MELFSQISQADLEALIRQFVQREVEQLNPSTFAQYGFVGLLLLLCVFGTWGLWKGVTWAGKRLIGEEGIFTTFLQKQSVFMDDVSGTVTGMSVTMQQQLGLAQEQKAITHELRDATTQLASGAEQVQKKSIRTHQAMCAMADAILAGTSPEQQPEVRPHVTEIKRILGES